MNLGTETETVEFKESTGELKEACSSIASILNKHGRGELYFGVSKKGAVRGQQVAESTLRQISQAITMSIEPRISPTIEKMPSDDGRDYVKVSFSGSDTPYACRGAYRIRCADEDVAMTTEQVRSMMREAIEREDPWDGRVSRRDISEVDEPTLRAFVERGVAKGRIPFNYVNVRDTLSRLGLLRDGQLTHAAEVLFCPSRDIQLKMGILATHARTEILDLHQESGTLFDLVDKASYYILNNTRRLSSNPLRYQQSAESGTASQRAWYPG